MRGSDNNLNQQPEPVRPENITVPQQIAALDGTVDDWWLLKLPIEAVVKPMVFRWLGFCAIRYAETPQIEMRPSKLMFSFFFIDYFLK
jgi:hypothetical protein